MRKIGLIVIVLYVVHQGRAESISEAQDRKESRFIEYVSSAFTMYRSTHEGVVPTDWTKLAEWLPPAGMDKQEKAFREFGDSRGFTNSIYEKYVFVDPPVSVFVPVGTRSVYADAKIAFMSAAPLPVDSHLVRYAVYLRGDEFFSGPIFEDQVKESFRLAGREIPTPPPAPSAIDPDREAQRIREELEAEISRQELIEQLRREEPELFEDEIKSDDGHAQARSRLIPPRDWHSDGTGMVATAEPEPSRTSPWLPVIALIVAGIGLAYLFRRMRG